ncbi:hypothetical protein PRK78_002946 [Emydomyces testavorans]|uniref:Pre-mRNA-splicing factor 38B n=1 Tax=Emydomyces testavorans TaxID=2070801 RepID=A0AAF0IK47_9EURO|nr:hypothetical protein PRK78_002946 [Emydomyces testavorans]
MPTPTNDTKAPNEINDDEYVAELLAKDAREYSLRFSALGVYGTAPKRPTSGAPKPNTRFLKHILHETDTHNANLKRKEQEEARERMEQLRKGNASWREESKKDHGGRERQSKRRRVESSKDKERDRERRHSHRPRDRKSENDERSSRHKNAELKKRTPYQEDSNSDNRKMSRRHHHREDYDHERRKKSHRRTRSRERSADRRRSYETERRLQRESPHHRPHREGTQTVSKKQRHYKSPPAGLLPSHESDHIDAESIQSSDSDPLSNLIGPLPPTKTELRTPPILPRGRGAHKVKSSTIDSHFTQEYDPALDVHLDDEDAPTLKASSRRPVSGMATQDDDWDMALEALRDRAAWKRRGAERLREAGFEDSMVERWENNKAFTGLDDGRMDGDVADVKWAKRGESREWDRGKVVDENGHVDIKPAW